MRVLLVIKKIIYAINIITIALALYIENILHDFSSVLLWIYIITALISLTLGIITAGIAGTPNNHLQERTLLRFEERTVKRDQFVIEVKEIEEGIWQVHDRFKTELDMKGWLRQKKYISELIALRFVLDAYNSAKQVSLSLPLGRQMYNLNELSIKFTDLKGKTYCYKIIKNKVIHKSLYMRYRLFGSLKVGRGVPNQYPYTKYYHMSLSDCYRFKLFEE